ncbi:MAG: endonuclease/exonuclease/phosphatase family protein [Armatimonadetes bacterium]|nr:endonuclease/exonuclease/phosphatase family protein [Armatimonadota bacterium]
MTYNVHACRGGDGRVSPARIARVIGEFFPDVVALQELDVGRRRSAFSHQAREIAAELQYAFYFYPAIEGREGHFGNAILSRLPLRLVKAGLLPRGLSAVPTEPRALLWVAVELPTHEVQVLNTHLSLLRQERLKQVEALLGPEWLGDPRCQESAVLCGDFNAGPGSPELGALAGRLQDVQDRLPEPARNTWFSSKPVRRLDYILVSSHFGVEAVHVPRTALVQDASDHLPLVSDLTLL